MLKSDYFRIEMNLFMQSLTTLMTLKSDYFRIEIPNKSSSGSSHIAAKIRLF